MRRFAVFDIDGTLIRWQLYHAVTDELLKATGNPTHIEAVRAARNLWKARTTQTAYKDYERTQVQAFESLLSSISVEDFLRAAQKVIEEHKNQVYSYTRNLIKTLQKQGYFLLAISGSQAELVAKIAEHYGFDDYVGSQYKHKNNRFTGEHIIPSQDKKGVLHSLISKHALSLRGSVAVGDSLSDAAMLEIVETPIAFNPDQQLFDRALSSGWKIVVERKNVVYTLEHHGGSYVLAPTDQ